MNKVLILSIAKQMNDPGDLFFNKDTRGGDDDLVEYRNFEWFRGKSNECVEKRFFSFYYAAQAFIDRYRMFDKDRNSPPNESRDILVGHPYDIESEDLLVVVHIKVLGRGKFHIISAYEAEEGSWYEEKYLMNKNLQQRVRLRRGAPVLKNPERKLK